MPHPHFFTCARNTMRAAADVRPQAEFAETRAAALKAITESRELIAKSRELIAKIDTLMAKP
jgi:hypothetical protein